MSERYEKLSDFIRNKMRMSHIYQPVMLLELIRHSGSASVTEIAKALLSHDASQIEYYEQITKNMVGKVLTKNRGLTERHAASYFLKGFEELSVEEIKNLRLSALRRLISTQNVAASEIWSHRVECRGTFQGASVTRS